MKLIRLLVGALIMVLKEAMSSEGGGVRKMKKEKKIKEKMFLDKTNPSCK